MQKLYVLDAGTQNEKKICSHSIHGPHLCAWTRTDCNISWPSEESCLLWIRSGIYFRELFVASGWIKSDFDMFSEARLRPIVCRSRGVAVESAIPRLVKNVSHSWLIGGVGVPPF